MRAFSWALLACAVLIFSQELRAQSGPRSEAAATTLPPKDPGVATIVSLLITGGGQMYAGETGRGLAMLGIGVGSLVLGTALSTTSCDPFEYECTQNLAPLTLGVLAAVGTWVYSIVDAPKSVQRQNLKRQNASARLRPNVGAGPQGQTHIGLSFRF